MINHNYRGDIFKNLKYNLHLLKKLTASPILFLCRDELADIIHK